METMGHSRCDHRSLLPQVLTPTQLEKVRDHHPETSLRQPVALDGFERQLKEKSDRVVI
jgi:hypothetical protein